MSGWLALKGLSLLIFVLAAAVLIRVFDRIAFPGVHFSRELRSGNRAVGSVVSALILGLFLSLAFLTGCSARADTPVAPAAPVESGSAVSSLAADTASDIHPYDMYFRRYGQMQFPWRDWRWFKGQGQAESGLNPRATSPAGAMGVMQIMPATARDLGLITPYDPALSIMAGIQYDRWLMDYLGPERPPPEDLMVVFAAYNCGPGRLDRIRDGPGTPYAALEPKLPAETRVYVARIRDLYRSMTWSSTSPG